MLIKKVLLLLIFISNISPAVSWEELDSKSISKYDIKFHTNYNFSNKCHNLTFDLPHQMKFEELGFKDLIYTYFIRTLKKPNKPWDLGNQGTEIKLPMKPNLSRYENSSICINEHDAIYSYIQLVYAREGTPSVVLFAPVDLLIK